LGSRGGERATGCRNKSTGFWTTRRISTLHGREYRKPGKRNTTRRAGKWSQCGGIQKWKCRTAASHLVKKGGRSKKPYYHKSELSYLQGDGRETSPPKPPIGKDNVKGGGGTKDWQGEI